MSIYKLKSNTYLLSQHVISSQLSTTEHSKEQWNPRKKLQCIRTNLTTDMNVGLNFFVPTTEECKLVAYAKEEEASGDQIWGALTRGFGSFPI